MRRLSVAAILVAIAAALVGMNVAGVGLVTAAAPPTLSITPSTKLVEGQFVLVTYSGLQPNRGVAFRECILNPKVITTDCTAPSPQGGVTDPTGAGQNYLQIHGGAQALVTAGSPPPPANPVTINCDSTHQCVLALMVSNTSFTGAVFAPLGFSPAPDNCPQHNNDILGVGASTAYSAIYRWEGVECLAPDKVKVGFTGGAIDDYVQPFYNGVGSPAPNTVAYGVTGPVPQMPSPPAGSGLTFKFAPLTTSGAVLAFLMYDGNGAQITSLTLTPDLIAQIMLGQIPNWNASTEINALNPTVYSFPSRIYAFHRAESTSVNYVMSSWLAAAAPKSWVSLPDTTTHLTHPLGASAIFPAQDAGSFAQGVTGANALGLKVATFAPADELGQGSVGFMDASTAAYYGLPTVQIKRADGSVVSATQQSIAAAINGDTVNNDNTLNLNYATTDPAAYPLAMPTYMVVPTNTLNPTSGAVLQTFLRYAVQGGQANLPDGYAPLSAALANRSLEVAKLIPVPLPTVTTPIPTVPTIVPLLPTVALPHPLLPPALPPAALGAGGSSAASSASCKTATTGAGCAPPPAQAVHVNPVRLQFGRVADWSAAPWVVPSVTGLGMLSLLGGLGLAAMAAYRRRVRF